MYKRKRYIDLRKDREMKKTNMIKNLTLLALLSIMAMLMTACGYSGTYYEIFEDTGDAYTIEIKGNTITENQLNEVYDFEENNGTLKVTFHGIPVKTLRADKYEGYDCLFVGDNSFPTYCKSEKGAEEIWAKKHAEEQARVEKEKAEAEAKLAESFKKITKAQKDVFDSLEGTEWVGEPDYSGLDISAAFKDGTAEIRIVNANDYSEDRNYTLIIRGKYGYNIEKPETTEDLINRKEDIILKVDKVIIDDTEKSTDDVTGYINLVYTPDGTDNVVYLKRALKGEIRLTSYADVSSAVKNNYSFSLIKK